MNRFGTPELRSILLDLRRFLGLSALCTEDEHPESRAHDKRRGIFPFLRREDQDEAMPLTSAEKLETQNGMRKSRTVVQLASVAWSCQVLSCSATPTIAEIPTEVSQSVELPSK